MPKAEACTKIRYPLQTNLNLVTTVGLYKTEKRTLYATPTNSINSASLNKVTTSNKGAQTALKTGLSGSNHKKNSQST